MADEIEVKVVLPEPEAASEYVPAIYSPEIEKVEEAVEEAVSGIESTTREELAALASFMASEFQEMKAMISGLEQQVGSALAFLVVKEIEEEKVLEEIAEEVPEPEPIAIEAVEDKPAEEVKPEPAKKKQRKWL